MYVDVCILEFFQYIFCCDLCWRFLNVCIMYMVALHYCLKTNNLKYIYIFACELFHQGRRMENHSLTPMCHF